MKVILPNLMILFFTVFLISSCMNSKKLDVEVLETSVNGNKLTQLTEFPATDTTVKITILPEIGRASCRERV